MQFNIEVESRQLDAALAMLPDIIERRIMRQALRKAAQPILKRARANVSQLRRTGVKTDPLRRGLKIRALKARRGRRRLGIAVQTPTRDALNIPAGSKWYYPAHIELGTRNAPAQPYLREALDASRQEILAILTRELRAGLTREAARLG